MFKKIERFIDRYIGNVTMPIKARMVNMLFFVGFVFGLVGAIAQIAIDGSPWLVAAMLVTSAAIAAALFVCNRFHLFDIGVWVIIIVISDILFPAAIFLVGGINTGIAAYFVFSTVIIFFLLQGRRFLIMLLVHFATIVLAYILAYNFPQLVEPMEPLEMLLNQITAVMLSGCCIGAIIKFMHGLYQQETRLLRSSKLALQREHQAFSNIFSNNTYVNVVFDTKGNVLDCNETAATFFGFNSREAFLKDGFEVVSASIPEFHEDGSRSIPLLERIRKTVLFDTMDFETTLAIGGAHRKLQVTTERIPYQDGFAAAFYCLDLSEAYQMRDDLVLRDKLLAAINKAAGILLSTDSAHLAQDMNITMGALAAAMDIDRMYVWRNKMVGDKLCYEQQYEWLRDAERDRNTTRILDNSNYIESIPEWEECFANDQEVNGPLASLSKNTRERFGRYKVKSVLALPLTLYGSYWGFMSFSDLHKEHSFSAEEVQLLRSGSLMIVNAIDKAMSEDLMATRLRQQQLMSEISQSFVSQESMPVLINNALQQIGSFLDADRVLVGIVEDSEADINTPVYSWYADDWWLPIPQQGFTEAVRQTFPEFAPESGYVPVVCCNDTRTEADGRYAVFMKADIYSFIWAPLYIQGRYWGMLSVETCSKPRVWSDSDVQLVSTVNSAFTGAVARSIMDDERNAALEAAIRASQAKSDFLSSMSHEMRTPMNAIIGMTSIGQCASDMDKKDEAFQKIEGASNHLLGVINDILDMSKIEANKLDLNQINFDFEKMLKRVVNVVNYRVDEKEQDFYVSIDADIPNNLYGDDQRLAQVITNLLSNAIKFTDCGGTIRLDAKCGEYHRGQHGEHIYNIKIAISDTGIGINQEQKARLFRSFEQAESGTTREFGGTGLGLAISKRIVEMMGGDIWVESEPGIGSTFTFSVPMQEGDEEAGGVGGVGVGAGAGGGAGAGAGAGGGAGGAGGAGNGPVSRFERTKVRMLAVDDQPEVLEFFRDCTERFGAYCDTATSGAEALALMEKHGSYDIYLIDWRMPGMDGIELTRRIRAADNDKAIVTMISATDWCRIEDDALAVGVDSYLSKPLFPSMILELIDSYILRGRKDGSQAHADFAPVAKNRSARQAVDDFSAFRILVVEDIEVNREIVYALLEPTNIKLESAENGIIALEKFAADPRRYNLVLMDVQMPQMDGLEATRRIRAMDDAWAREVPIIAMTANVFRDDVQKCLDVGMNGHVGKPLDIKSFLSILRSNLKQSPTQ